MKKNNSSTQVFQSGNILLHQPSNSNYCVSQPCPKWARLKPAWRKLAAPGGYFYYLSSRLARANRAGTNKMGSVMGRWIAYSLIPKSVPDGISK